MSATLSHLVYTLKAMLPRGAKTGARDMRVEIGIKSTYLPNWKRREGVRELWQNGADAAKEWNAPFTFDFYEGTNGGVIRLHNEGVTLPHEALLMGHTTKSERADLRGQFGEGLKLGCLALLREGHKVVIRSGSEVWTPTIERSERFKADVLVFNVVGGRKDINRVRVEVHGVTREQWEEVSGLFLTGDYAKVSTSAGELLLDEAHKGRMYVKGIFVEALNDLRYGYNFNEADLDRDRRMVRSFDRKWHTRQIWDSALAQRPDLLDPFWSMLQEEAPDTEGVAEWPNYMSSTVTEAMAERFEAQFGEGAIPVATIAESKDLEHLGATGIVANRGVRGIVEKVVGNSYTVQAELKRDACEQYSWHELTDQEKENLEYALMLVNEAVSFELDLVDIVDFRAKSTLGQAKEGRVLLAKRILSDRKETLATLIHEVAHIRGLAGDGEHRHIAVVEHIWATIVEALWTA